MAKVRLSARAAADLERIFEFIARTDPHAALTVARQIREAVQILANHPLIGRRVETDYRELVISKGKSGYVALYRWFEETDTILILAIKHQLEAGYADDLWGGQR